MRKLTGMAVIAAAVALFAIPSDAHAGDDISSSMTAGCIGGDCSTIRFVLSLPAGYNVQQVHIDVVSGSWAFSSVTSIWYGGSNVTSDFGLLIGGGGVQAQATDVTPYENGTPLIIYATMSSWGTYGDLISGDMEYGGDGYNVQNATLDHSFEGTVTPEPVTVSLLLSGLVGVAGVARRRRKGDLG